jgi:phosphoribosyl-ATP pyrophosphohydrolase
MNQLSLTKDEYLYLFQLLKDNEMKKDDSNLWIATLLNEARNELLKRMAVEIVDVNSRYKEETKIMLTPQRAAVIYWLATSVQTDNVLHNHTLRTLTWSTHQYLTNL